MWKPKKHFSMILMLINSMIWKPSERITVAAKESYKKDDSLKALYEIKFYYLHTNYNPHNHI